jgi:hypothetical protein
MFANKQTNGWLSMNTSDKIMCVDEAYSITTTVNCDGPVARNVFALKKYDSGKPSIFDNKENILMYGQ